MVPMSQQAFCNIETSERFAITVLGEPPAFQGYFHTKRILLSVTTDLVPQEDMRSLLCSPRSPGHLWGLEASMMPAQLDLTPITSARCALCKLHLPLAWLPSTWNLLVTRGYMW